MSEYTYGNMWKIFKTYADYHEGDKGRYKAIHEANDQSEGSAPTQHNAEEKKQSNENNQKI